jgi:hypothetical protein
MDYGHMQESILKMSSPSSKKYAKVHEKAPKLKIQEPKKSQIPGSRNQTKTKSQSQYPIKNKYPNSKYKSRIHMKEKSKGSG